ncbi:hypothetical protein M514_00951, partial [Trichuris suis]
AAKVSHKYNNFKEVARRWRECFSSTPPSAKATRNNIAGFEERGSVDDVPRASRPRCSDSQDRKRRILEV